MKTYTINAIQAEMNNRGSHWWDRGSMQFFNTRVGKQVYQGSGGIYFVTSEKGPDGKRLYSVRQYKPDSKEIDTIGNFCSMTRAQAEATAARLAGEDAVTISNAFHPVSSAEQLSLDVSRGGGKNCGTPTANLLIRLANKHHKLMEDACNGDPTPELDEVAKRLTETAASMGCGVVLSGDPRGCTVKLVLPNGDTNDWSKEGWCVPTR